MSDGIKVTLDGRGETLRPTLRAAREVNAGFGSFTEAYRKLAAFDLEAYIVIVAAGLGKKPKDVEETVYRNGLPDLTEPLSEFVTLLANGGRPPVKPEETPPKGEA